MLDRSRIRARLPQLAISLAAALLAFASVAEARLERVRWTHPRGDVQSFDVRVRVLSAATSDQRSLGLPAPGSSGVYEANVEVGDSDVEISLRAHGPGGTVSAWTATQIRRAEPAPASPAPPTLIQIVPVEP